MIKGGSSKRIEACTTYVDFLHIEYIVAKSYLVHT